MNIPNISPTHDYGPYWNPVVFGQSLPDEWQAALMKLDEDAHAIGLFYTKDVDKWIRENNDFIPPEFWSYQYEKYPSENGVMGMELYMAHSANRESKLRAENKAVIETLVVGQNYGTFRMNGKRVTGCTLKEIKGGTVTFTGGKGKYTCEFWTDAKNVPSMIEGAKSQGWRK